MFFTSFSKSVKIQLNDRIALVKIEKVPNILPNVTGEILNKDLLDSTNILTIHPSETKIIYSIQGMGTHEYKPSEFLNFISDLKIYDEKGSLLFSKEILNSEMWVKIFQI